MTDRRGSARLAAEVVFVGVAWGVMYALYPVGLARSGPVWLAALRFAAFFAGALLVALARRVPLRPQGRADWIAILAYAGLNVALHNVLLMAGSHHAPVAFVAMATGLNPLLTLVLARLFLPGVRLAPRALLGVAVGFSGVAVLAWQGGADGAHVALPWALVVLGGVLAWSSGSVALKASRSTLPPLVLAVWGALLGTAVLTLGAVAVEPLPTFDLPLLAVVAFSGLGGGLAAFVVWGAIVRDHGPQRANLASYVSPVAASLTAWVLLGQALRPVHAAAYVLVAAGLTLSLRSTQAKAAPAPSPE